MEELKEYLNKVFENVPETPEMLRAKSELLQMMEDKYDGLIDDGMDEKEAISTVISEFGDFDEVGEELGIDKALRESRLNARYSTDSYGADGAGTEGFGAGAAGAAGFAAGAAASAAGYGPTGPGPAPQGGFNGAYNQPNGGPYNGPNPSEKDGKQKNYEPITMNSAQLDTYISFSKSHAFKVGAGVALCILAPYFAAIFDDVFERIIGHAAASALSSCGFFLSIALAVVCFITAASQFKRGIKLKGKALILDEPAMAKLKSSGQSVDGTTSLMIGIGVGFCILGPAVSALSDLMPGVLHDLFGPGILLCVAIGVFFIIYGSSTKERMKSLSKAIKRANAAGMTPNTQSGPQAWSYEPKKGFPVWAIVLLVVFIGGGIGVATSAALGINRLIFWPFGMVSGHTEPYDLTEEFDPNSVTAIKADSAAGNVEMKLSDSDKIVCKVSGNFKKRPKIELKNGTINIVDEDSGFNLIGSGSKNAYFRIFVPKDKVLNCVIDMAAGDAVIEQVLFDRLSIEMAAGDLRLNSCNVSDTLELDMAAGDVNIDNSDIKIVEADMAAGDFRYHFSDRNKAKEYSYELDTSLGDVHIMGQTYGDEVEINADPDIGKRMEIDLSAGDIIID